MKKISLFLLGVMAFLSGMSQQTSWSDIETIFGKKGIVTGDVFKITYPRTDLKVTVGDLAVAPGLALTSWIGLLKMGNTTMMMGDLVVLDAEEAKVVAKLVSVDLQVTAIHNHLIGETPAIKYIHFSGNGAPGKLAESIKAVLQVTSTPMAAPMPAAQTVTPPDWSRVEAVLGSSGKHNGMLLQYSFARKEELKESGMVMPPPIGMATGINFQLDGTRAAITGDFVLMASEVNPVFKVLVENGITPTAIHNHMLFDNPRLFMMHFWAVDEPEKLAKALKLALSKTNHKDIN